MFPRCCSVHILMQQSLSIIQRHQFLSGSIMMQQLRNLNDARREYFLDVRLGCDLIDS